MDLRDVFARNLRLRREEKGLTQEELADAAGINRTYISKMETAATWAGLEIIAKAARVLDIDPAELLRSPKGSTKRR